MEEEDNNKTNNNKLKTTNMDVFSYTRRLKTNMSHCKWTQSKM